MTLSFLECEINFSCEFESESFSFVRQTLELKNFSYYLAEYHALPGEHLTFFMLRVLRDQSVKLRRLAWRCPNLTRRKLMINCKCFVWLLTNLDFLLCKEEGAVVLEGFSQTATHVVEEIEKDEGFILEEDEGQTELSPFARSFFDVPQECCGCQTEESTLDYEGSFLKTLLIVNSSILSSHLHNFLASLEEEKHYYDDGNMLNSAVLQDSVDQSFHFDSYLTHCTDLEYLNQFLFALCILMTRRCVSCVCCNVLNDIATSSFVGSVKFKELLLDVECQ